MTVFCSEANGNLMMRQGRACLLLWGRRYTVVEMRTTRCHKLIQVSVITMLLGTLGVKLVVSSAGTDHTWPCVKVISAAHAWGRHRQQ